MRQSGLYLTSLLAFATLAFVSSQPEQVQPSPVPVEVSGGQQSGVGQVSNAPTVNQGSHAGPSPAQSVVGVEVSQPQGGVVPVEHHQQHYPGGVSYYAPAGMIQVVGEQQQQVGPGGNKPGVVRAVEQYGQPESAALPPNYKPFGSWGLYIGGNPADGYYTNYYKQLGNSVEKQQYGVEQASGSVKPSSAVSPVLKQAISSPFSGGDYYPFAYSMNDISSVSRGYGVAAGSVPTVEHSPVISHSVPSSPVQIGAQVYGSPASFEGNSHYAADSYATKKFGSAYVQKEATKEAPSAGKGYQSRVYVYPSQVGPMSAPIHGVQQQHQQVVAYPVPVASQIVGSQAGVDGAFSPYGVHAFTRYAVKPVADQSVQGSGYQYGVTGQQQPVGYKQQSAVVYNSQPSQHQSGQVVGSQYYPFSYYGYPMGQLHYSQGSIVPSSFNGVSETGVPVGVQGVHNQVGGQSSGVVMQSPSVQVEPSASEKSETEDKSSPVASSPISQVMNKQHQHQHQQQQQQQQKRA